MSDSGHTPDGIAALALCEATLLALVEADLLDLEALKEILEDAVTGYRAAGDDSPDQQISEAAVKLIDEMGRSLLAVSKNKSVH